MSKSLALLNQPWTNYQRYNTVKEKHTVSAWCVNNEWRNHGSTTMSGINVKPYHIALIVTFKPGGNSWVRNSQWQLLSSPISSPGRLASAEQGQERSLGTCHVFQRRPEQKQRGAFSQSSYQSWFQASSWEEWVDFVEQEQKINLVQNWRIVLMWKRGLSWIS